MASLFTELLARMGPKELANRLNITRRTAAQLAAAPLSRFPGVTAKAQTLTRSIKANILTRAGASKIEAARHTRMSFASVTNVRDRITNVVDSIVSKRIEYKASRLNMSIEQYRSYYFEDIRDKENAVRQGMRLAERRLEDIEQDSP